MERTIDRSGRNYLVYVDKGDEDKRFIRNMMMTQYLVPEFGEDEQPNIYFDCLVEAENFAGCNGHINFGRNLSLEFGFSHTQLHRWREIREAVMKLLDGFVQEPER